MLDIIDPGVILRLLNLFVSRPEPPFKGSSGRLRGEIDTKTNPNVYTSSEAEMSLVLNPFLKQEFFNRLRGFVQFFFGCEACRSHFLRQFDGSFEKAGG